MTTPSIGDILAITDKIYGLYQRYKAEHENIARVGKEVDTLGRYLIDLRAILDQYGKELKRQAPDRYRNLTTLLKEIDTDSREVLSILKEFDKNKKSSARVLRQVRFIWGTSNPETLSRLADSLERSITHVDRWIHITAWMDLRGLAVGSEPTQASLTVAERSQDVLFLDTHDRGRAVVAQCYAQLVEQWTTLKGFKWPLRRLHSAGIRLEGSEKIAFAQRAAGIKLSQGANAHPITAALDALFDNGYFNFEYKQRIWNREKTHHARSLSDSYNRYAYVVVFDDNIKRAFENVARYLEEHKQAGPMRGKVIHLANYHPNAGVRQIRDPSWDRDVKAGWNKAATQIKLALKTFMTQELGWVKPPPGA